ncbi:MAG: hypothetical protein KR126chlam2_00864 [Chlamydiae bacterium]|nr:hypothetical protein [Chlamydiota bacterium]
MVSQRNVTDALSRIHKIVEKRGGIHVLHTSEISRSDRELLVRHDWLEEIIRGWYFLVRPDALPGDSSAWYASFWDFLNVYLSYHHGTEYCLSAECSLDLHLGNYIIPKQVIVIARRGSGITVPLPFDTSILVYADPKRLPEERITLSGLQTMSLPYALCKVTPTFFHSSPQDAEIALQSIRHPSELIRVIVEHNFQRAAGRLIGAYRFVGNKKMVDQLSKEIAKAGIRIQETNPFKHQVPLLTGSHYLSPHSSRILAMWKAFRPFVLDHFPKRPAVSMDPERYLQHVTELYPQDAYHSLSIEGYHVNKQLIEKVENNHWNPDFDPEDQQLRDALAARGYFEAFHEVKQSVTKILKGSLPGQIVEDDLTQWYQKLFSPSVRAKLLRETDLLGYRRSQVYIRYSRHTPLAKEYVCEAMDTLFQCLKDEEDAGVRALLGHFIFVFIHPYIDGNGRIGRFLMNTMLASGGYPWTIIHVEERARYFSALETASVDHDILPFVQFIAAAMKRSDKE